MTSEWSLSDCLHRRPGDEFDLGYLFGVKRNCVRTERGVYNPCSDYNLSFIQRKRRKTSEKRKCSVSGSNIHENNIAPTHSIKVCEMQSLKAIQPQTFPFSCLHLLVASARLIFQGMSLCPGPRGHPALADVPQHVISLIRGQGSGTVRGGDLEGPP